MKKISYAITLNFFVPDEVVERLKEVQVSGLVSFDWRKSDFVHCTVKAIYYGTEIPDPKVIENWVKESKAIFSHQKPFDVAVKGITHWQTALVSNVESNELLKFHRRLFKVLPSFQPQFEDEKYWPHISIAIGEELNVTKSKLEKFGKFKVDEIQLMLWGMRNPKQPKVLHEFKLKQGRNL